MTKNQSAKNVEASWTALGRSTRETIESIVIAFILAFVFRAFVVEAYRIPTGSMAPTLYGAHRTRICPDCGTQYAYEIIQQQTPNGIANQPPRFTLCPNCLWNTQSLPLFVDGRPIVDNGDRILVMKLGYELCDLFPPLKKTLGPQRWDVVVFKDPSNPDINFIKRLIGLPGEKIELILGDVYANDKIQRKTPQAKESLWFPVYNNDYLPTRRTRVDPPEVPGWYPTDDPASEKLWKTSGRVFSFNDQKLSNQTGSIAFVGHTHDFYGYDNPENPLNGEYIVSDLKMDFMLVMKDGEGRFDLILSKWDDVFIATLDTTGKAQLSRTSRASFANGGTKPTLISEAQFPAIEKDTPVQISFENLDYQVTLTIDGKTVLQTTDEQYRPDINVLRSVNRETRQPIIQIAAHDCSARLWHVKLFRDIYYRPMHISRGQLADPDNPNSDQFGLGHGVAGNPIQLGPTDYYVLGDNSPESQDSRLWAHIGPHLLQKYREGKYQPGTVPADQMVGKAFFVYWPAGFRLFGSGPALIPNVGEMRFIR
jgi:signal peptidase I